MSTLSSKLSSLLSVSGALLGTALLVAAPANAKSGVYYEAKLAAPVEKQTEIIRGVVWRCAGDTCRAAKSTSRASNICARLSRKMGDIAAFSVKGESMDAEAVAECNDK